MSIDVSLLEKAFYKSGKNHDLASYTTFAGIFMTDLLYLGSKLSVLKLEHRSCGDETLAYRIREILDPLLF